MSETTKQVAQMFKQLVLRYASLLLLSQICNISYHEPKVTEASKHHE